MINKCCMFVTALSLASGLVHSVYLAGVDDGLQLQSRQQAIANGRLRYRQGVCDVRRRDT